MLRELSSLILIIVFGINANGQSIANVDKTKIQNRIEQLRTAHLESSADLADQIYHKDLVLVSQSGKKYGKADALRNIQNKFESYENAKLEWQSISDDVVLTTFVNRRKYANFPPGRFRLVAIWKKESSDWQLISLQSSRLKKKG